MTLYKTWQPLPAGTETLFLDSSGRVTSVLRAQGAVVGAVAALLVEVDVGSDAALQQGLGRPGVVAHAQEDLVRLVLAEEAQGVHLQDKPTAQSASDRGYTGQHSNMWKMCYALGTTPN